MEHIYEECTSDEPSSRPTLDSVLEKLKDNSAVQSVESTSLGISQATPMENFNKNVEEVLDKNEARSDVLWSLPTNDDTDACTFLCFVSAYRIRTAELQRRLPHCSSKHILTSTIKVKGKSLVRHLIHFPG